MKKLILLALTALMMVGCASKHNTKEPLVTERYRIIVMDSCEYIKHQTLYGYAHKGNCKFCEARKKQELKELVELLKDK